MTEREWRVPERLTHLHVTPYSDLLAISEKLEAIPKRKQRTDE
jgi:hypothetical protein